MSEASLVEVLEEHPELNTFGIGVFDPSSKSAEQREAELAKGRADLAQRETRVREIVAWLHSNLGPAKTPRWSSYTLKHLAESQLGYVTNGEFIAAGLVAGFPYRYEAPNVLFGVSRLDGQRLTSEQRGSGRD